MNKRFFRAHIFLSFLLLSSCSSVNKRSVLKSSAKTQEEQQALTPWQALEKLKMGNERFLSNTQKERDLLAQVASSQKQFPFAVLFGCMDSRGSPEILFDQGIGDIFTERLAGNVVNSDVIGGMEFGTKLVGAKLIVVLGHTACGAIKGACEDAKLGNLTSLLKKIQPAVHNARREEPQMSCEDPELINLIGEKNIRDAIKHIQDNSPVLRKLIKAGKLGIVGAMHEIATGKIIFFEDKNLLPGAPK